MTRDRDEKRLVRAKAERERTSYVEARRRFDRSGGVGDGLGGGGDATGLSSGPPPVRTTPLLMRVTHPSGLEIGLLAMEESADEIAFDLTSSDARCIPKASLRLVGGEPFPVIGSGGAATRMQRRVKGSLEGRAAELLVGFGRLPEREAAGSTSTLGTDEARDLLFGDVLDGVAVRLQAARLKHEHILFEPPSQPRAELIADPSAGDGLLPTSIKPVGLLVDVSEGPAHWLLSMEHWSRSTSLNVMYDSDEIEAGPLFGSGFEVIDDRGRRYDAVMNGGGGIGRRIVNRQRLFPRVASDTRTLAFYRRGAQGNDPIAVLDLGRSNREEAGR